MYFYIDSDKFAGISFFEGKYHLIERELATGFLKIEAQLKVLPSQLNPVNDKARTFYWRYI